ncbi:MAG: S41 family peptidase [Bryobacteraceae bacterium]
MSSRFKWTVVGSSACVVAFLLLGTSNSRAVPTDDVYGHLRVYTQVLERIKTDYVEKPNMSNVTLGAINGLLESVDPFASYLNPDQFREYEKKHGHAKGDVGLILAKRYGYVAVVDALPGSPAADANISTGDLIDSIKGVETRDMPLAYANELLDGPPNSSIEFTVLRLKNPNPQKITLKRVQISFPPVTARMMPGNVGYVDVASLAGKRVAETKSKIEGLKKHGAKYLVLDLRHCATGSQPNGIPLANLFLNKGEITYLQGQKYSRQQSDARSGKQVWSGPLVAIVDRGTAGGAEIAAAALLDNKRAQVVGERTYGDAALRKVIEMNDGSAVILSVAKYYAPDGKAIQDTGVTPSVQLVENDNSPDYDENGNPIPGYAPKNPQDNLLKQAVDLVTGKTTIAELRNEVNGPIVTAPPPIIQANPTGAH